MKEPGRATATSSTPTPEPREPRGLYDVLYRASPGRILWSERPGRLVARIREFCPRGLVVDAGCGDGKNALFLEQEGFQVIGHDSSPLALEGLANRFLRSGRMPRGRYELRDVRDAIEPGAYALVPYGLFHCLPPGQRGRIHGEMQAAIRPGGVVLFACLTNHLPLPDGHCTDEVALAELDEVESLLQDWVIEEWEEGEIVEEHAPLVGRHRHSAVWVAARRPRG